ncbi:PREDICTED: protein FAM43B [Nanorana parkeri]|uniref:protein FAM43B n=1 Tax=Nanorana parkeri TaxID=125878 RepID=UPI0008541EE5|nr:PREDICTED: protein FAM43B [Nanorana parkeri]
MLPWKRSKFVLAKKDKKTTKGVSYSSLLSSFMRSCPDLLPQTAPLARLGKVFSTRRQKVELNAEDPSYTAWYLGNAVTLHAKGEGCTAEAVSKIWEKSEYGGYSTKMELTLGPYGIRMTPCKKGARRTVHTYLLRRVACCAADAGHPKVFSWVYRHQVKNKAVVLRCHAVLVSRADKARAMAQTLCQNSLAAFRDFKRLKRQSDFRRGQRELLGELAVPRMPLRKVLNGTCSYNPPAERSKAVPRLGPMFKGKRLEGDNTSGVTTAGRDWKNLGEIRKDTGGYWERLEEILGETGRYWERDWKRDWERDWERYWERLGEILVEILGERLGEILGDTGRDTGRYWERYWKNLGEIRRDTGRNWKRYCERLEETGRETGRYWERDWKRYWEILVEILEEPGRDTGRD